MAGRFTPFEDLMQIWAPVERISLSEWAEKYFILTSDYGATSGLIKLESWQRGIFDAYTDDRVWQLVLMVATQMVKTLLLQISAAYDICVDPDPILFVGYKDDDAEKFSKERFGPMCNTIQQLRARIAPAKSRDTENTIAHKRFPGGTIEFVGSIAPANLGRRTIRYLKFDEIDQYDASSGNQGHAVDLGIKRADRYGFRRKVVMASTPTVKGFSRIGEAYEESDQRKGFVGCHHCGTMQILSWEHVRFNSKLHISDAAKSARYECVSCNKLWLEQDRRRNIAEAFEWRATNPPFDGIAGFTISHLYSRLVLHSMQEMTKTYLTALKKRKLQVFKNTDLAELWEEEGERPDYERIMARAEDFDTGADRPLQPGIVFLMQGVDIQDKRIEVQTLGFGVDDEGALHIWSVDYAVIELFEPGGGGKMTSSPEYYVELGRLLEHRYRHPSGAMLPIVAMLVDVGHNPEPVYTFAKLYAQPTYGPLGLDIQTPLTVICIRGRDSELMNAIHRVTGRETARTRKGEGNELPIVTLGTGYLKTELYSELVGRGELRRIHLTKHYSEDYFRGLVAEKRVVSPKTGAITYVKMFPRNEPLDTWVYAKGGYYILKADRWTPEDWIKMRRKMGIPEPGGTVQEKKPAVRPTTVKSPYLD